MVSHVTELPTAGGWGQEKDRLAITHLTEQAGGVWGGGQLQCRAYISSLGKAKSTTETQPLSRPTGQLAGLCGVAVVFASANK